MKTSVYNAWRNQEGHSYKYPNFANAGPYLIITLLPPPPTDDPNLLFVKL